VSDRWDTAAGELAAVAGEARVRRVIVCERIAGELIEAGALPPWRLGAADDSFTLCADRYWRRRFLVEPSLSTARACADWLRRHINADLFPVVGAGWALGYGFITRSTVDSASDVAGAVEDLLADTPSPEVAWFMAAYHAAKLRANFHGGALAEFVDRSPLAVAAGALGKGFPLAALRCFAAFRTGEPDAADRAVRCLDDLDSIGPASTEICLHGMAMAPRPEDHAGLLVEHARRAIARWPDHALLYYRLAEGLRQAGDLDEATDAVDHALALLPADGTSDSHDDFQAQFLRLRDSIGGLRIDRARHQNMAR
jgi:hypothetical protein